MEIKRKTQAMRSKKIKVSWNMDILVFIRGVSLNSHLFNFREARFGVWKKIIQLSLLRSQFLLATTSILFLGARQRITRLESRNLPDPFLFSHYSYETATEFSIIQCYCTTGYFYLGKVVLRNAISNVKRSWFIIQQSWQWSIVLKSFAWLTTCFLRKGTFCIFFKINLRWSEGLL